MTPQPEGLNSSTSSAAREALQSNLDSTMTLNRKKSWFGSARDAFHRGAKGVVGHLRNGDRKGSYVDDQENVDPEGNDSSSSGHYGGADNDSLTPLRPSRANQQKASTPKSTISSLRQHIHTSGRSRARRGALTDIMTAEANDVRLAVAPGLLVTTDNASGDDTNPEEKSPTKQHSRKSSVAKSVIGSLRSLSRRGTMSKPTSPMSDPGSPTKRAFPVPLPSSPIDIPAPTLKLNLGDAANISTSFLRQPVFDCHAELMAATDPIAKQTVQPPTYYTRLPGEGSRDDVSSTGRSDCQPKRPAGELLELPIDDFGLNPPAGPATPMPGTGVQMELNGVAEIFHEPPLFERSVEARDTPEKRDTRGLKKMISLDALAKEHAKESPMGGARLTPASARKIRDFSAATVQTCPLDMAPLTRQLAALSTPSAGRRDSATGIWKSDDPFAPGNALSDFSSELAVPVPSAKDMAASDRPNITSQTVGADVDHNMLGLSSREETLCLNDTSAGPKEVSEEMLLGQPQARITAQPAPPDSA